MKHTQKRTKARLSKTRSESLRRALADPAIRRKIGDASRRAWAEATPRARKRRAKRNSQANRRAWADPEKHALRIETLKRAHSSPEAREHHRAAAIQRREQLAESTKGSWKNPKVRRDRTKGIRSAWADPERRNPWIESIQRAMTPEVRAKQSKTLKATCQNPEVRKRKSEAMLKVWGRLEHRRRAIKAMRKAAKNPVVRDKKSKAAKKLWAERNAILDAAKAASLQTQKPTPKKRGRRPVSQQDRQSYQIAMEGNRGIPRLQELFAIKRHPRGELLRAGYSEQEIDSSLRAQNPKIAARWFVSMVRNMPFDTVAKYHKRSVGTKNPK